MKQNKVTDNSSEDVKKPGVRAAQIANSAVEAALAVAGVAGSTVHLSYRSKAFSRVNRTNRTRLQEAVGRGRITLHLQTNVTEIRRKHTDSIRA